MQSALFLPLCEPTLLKDNMYRLFVWQGEATGGAARITNTFAHYAAAHGVKVTLGVFAPIPTESLPQIVLAVPHYIPSSFRSLIASLSYRRRHAQLYNGVYAHTLGFWQRKGSHLFIHDAADLDAKLQQMPTRPMKIAYYIWHWLYLYACLRPASAILVGSDAFKQYLRRQHISADKIHPSASFYNEETFKCVLRATPALPYRLLFVGDYADPAKQFPLLIEAVVGRRQYELHVVGGKPRSRDRNIFYHGYVMPRALYDHLARAHLLVMPSSSEGFSIALLEALATGLPCLVAKAAVPPELAGIKNIFLADSFSQTDIDAYVQEIVSRYGQYAVCDSRIQKFSRQKILDQEWQAIQPLLKS